MKEPREGREGEGKRERKQEREEKQGREEVRWERRKGEREAG